MFFNYDISKVYIIAEIGQNHQGRIDIAKELMICAKNCGVDCVKFQKSKLSEKFNFLALERPYESPNSWGDTYGKHKQHLEFSEENYKELQRFACDLKIDFTASAMDRHSLHFLHQLEVPFIKIGSGDACNSQLLREAAKLGSPLLVSTGMCNMDDVKRAYTLLSAGKSRFGIMHCVSSYPTPYNELNLNVINTYKQEFPDIPIGYSGHEQGIECTITAVHLGAKIVERHFTLNKNWKGSDHASSLEPHEMKQLVLSIRQHEINPTLVDQLKFQVALGTGLKKIQDSEENCIAKLGKTLVASKNLTKGHVLTEHDINVKVAEPRGIHCRYLDDVIGQEVLVDILYDHSVLWHQLSQQQHT